MSVRLAEFQRAAVERIVERLKDPTGSRRFLLADEVGLGKTLVAAGVIDRLLEGRRHPLVVVYLCSNAEIAEQNRKKLDPGAPRPVRRVAQLALDPGEQRAQRQVFSFTPGTSLRDGTGMAWERRLVMYLLYRLLDKDVGRGRWREFFRCGVSRERWDEEARLSALREEFGRRLTLPFQDHLRDAWRRPVEIEDRPVSLARDIDDEVDAFRSSGASDTARYRRNRIVATLRRAVQQVALDTLDPDLVILDEVQRFKEVLKQASDQASVASRLFRRRGMPVLILSATPYKMLTLEHEEAEGGHYEDLCETLDFLRCRTPADGADPIREDLARFRTRLLEGHFLKGPDLELRAIKDRLETQLKQVMCRTERNWYVDDARKGVEEVRSTGSAAVPGVEELTEFVRLRRFLMDHVETGYRITEYWKSAPSPFTFMDWQYAVMKAIRHVGRAIPEGLVAGSAQMSSLAARNQRTRALFELIFKGERGGGGWPFLWMRPTYCYYPDAFFRGSDPTKFLLFSSWRFVPKMISVLVSEEVERRLAVDGVTESSTPLRFTEKRSFHVFDVCFPSPALASIVDPAELSLEAGITARRLEERSERVLRERLEARGVIIGDVGNPPTWEVVARLEAGQPWSARLVGELENAAIDTVERAGARHFRRDRRRYLRWMSGDGEPLRVSRQRLRHLARVAAWSPAVSILRALWSVYPEHRGTMPAGLVSVCFNALRNYLNRPLVQAVFDGHARGRGKVRHYAANVLRYCRDAHVQAVLDEYVFLLHEVARCETVSDALDQVRRVLALGAGTPKVNTARRRSTGMEIDPDPVVRRAHVALAFGEDVAEEGSEGEISSGAERKTAVREAFNSPFWPFVLATTSVGQEGLDFHLYCRDIIHWNLPSNPVDLEQREGRINRRDGLAIRQGMAADWPLVRAVTFRREGDTNPWQWVFAALDGTDDLQRYKHGLYPHWVYESDGGSGQGLRRHLFHYEASVDVQRYAALKERLALYRLVFGQPRQQDILEALTRKMAEANGADLGADLHRMLTYYMINLSPFKGGYALEQAQVEAGRILGEPDRERRLEMINRVITDVRQIAARRASELHETASDLERLIAVAEAGSRGDQRAAEMRQALTALLYVRNPYDRLFDTYPTVGLQDDADVIRAACHRIFSAAGGHSAVAANG